MTPEAITFTCAICSATLPTNTRSEEKAGALAAKERWLLFLPHGEVWCRRCHNAYEWVGYRRVKYASGTV